MDKSERRFQGKISADYELVMQGIPHLSAIDEQVVNAIRAYTPAVPAPRLNVLEIGCGSGRATAKLLASRLDIKPRRGRQRTARCWPRPDRACAMK